MTLMGHLLSLVYGLVSTFAVLVHAAGAFGLTAIALLTLACFVPHGVIDSHLDFTLPT